MQKVLIIYRFLPHYRLEFYEQLRNKLLEENVQLDLIYGKTNTTDSLKNDEVEIPWARYIRNRYLKIGKVELLWQPCLRYTKGYDLIIVEQANKLIINYLLILLKPFSKFKFALWGHGRNMQIKNNSIRNRFKKIFLTRNDAYFAYTSGVADYIVEQGYPREKIVIVQNAIDTTALREHYLSIQEAELEELRKEMGIYSRNVAIYCGGMYPEKRIPELLNVCETIKREIPDFHMIFIGSGIDSVAIEDAASNKDYIHYLGTKIGMDRVIYFRLASLQLMPGLVGLAVLDSFALETPLITTEYPYHSPEIEYLENFKNGLITDNNMELFASEVIKLFKNSTYIEMMEGCKKSAGKYTIDAMADNFKEGILSQIKN